MIFSEVNEVMTSLSSAYANVDYLSTKRQILAIVAADFPSSTLKAYFPGATNYLIKQARDHAYQNGKYQKLSDAIQNEKPRVY